MDKDLPRCVHTTHVDLSRGVDGPKEMERYLFAAVPAVECVRGAGVSTMQWR